MDHLTGSLDTEWDSVFGEESLNRPEWDRFFEKFVLNPSDYADFGLKVPIKTYFSATKDGIYAVIPILGEFGFGESLRIALDAAFSDARSFQDFLVRNEWRLSPGLTRTLSDFRGVLA